MSELKQDSFMPKQQIEMLELIIKGENPAYSKDVLTLISEVYYWRSIESAQSALIMQLGEALSNAVIYRGAVHLNKCILQEALSAFESWKDGK